MGNSELRVADVIARRLAQETTLAFGVPGGEVLSLIDALRAAHVRFVLARHETSAGFMAEGVNRVRGDLALLVATVGPGVANTINVVSHAQQARRPMIVLTGCVDPADQTSYTHQVFDHQRVLRPLCKASFQVAARTAAETIERAVQLATEGVAGPVHVDVPVSVADVRIPHVERGRWSVARTTTHRDDAAFTAAREALAGARRPLVLAGLGLLRGGGAAVLRSRHAKAPRPLMTTYEAKGVIDEHDPFCIGAVGLSPRADEVALPFVADADVVLLAGYDPVEMRHGWRHPFHPDATVLEVTRRPGLHGMHHASVSLVGEPAAILDALLDGVPASMDDAWIARTKEARSALVGRFPVHDEWGPSAIFDVLREKLPDDAVVAVDTGAHRILLCEQWRFRRGGRLLQSNGTSTMACAIPFAVGAKLAAPDAEVVAIVGDGGLEMALGELGTVRDLGLPLTIVVLDDRSLALIEKKQRARGLPNVGVDFGDQRAEPPGTDFPGTDYARIAGAFGGVGVRVEALAALHAELDAAKERTSFTLLHCPIPRRAYDGRI